jgi:hypothetical protein
MIRQSRRAPLVAAAGACLALSACGGGSATTAKEPAAAPTITVAPVKVTGHFCADANAVMRQQPTHPTGQKVTVAVARTELEGIVRVTAAGFTALEPEAPSALRGPIKTIAGVYAADEQRLATYGSIREMGTSIVRANTTGAGGAAFRKVLAYISKACK